MRRLVIEMQINIGHDTTQARPPTKALKVSLAVERNEDLNFNQILCCDIETFSFDVSFPIISLLGWRTDLCRRIKDSQRH